MLNNKNQNEVWQDMQDILLEQKVISETFPIDHFVSLQFLEDVYK